MNLTRKQLRRSNKIMFVSILCLSILFALTNLGSIMSGIVWPSTVFLFILFVLGGVSVSIIYATGKDKNISKYLFSVVWLVMLVAGSYSTGSVATYPVSFSIMVACIVYLDMKETLFINLSTVILHLSNVVYEGGIKKVTLDSKQVAIMLVMAIMLCVIDILITKLFMTCMIENNDALMERVNKQKKTVTQVSQTTDNVSKIFEKLVHNLDTINGQAEKNRQSMHEVAESMDSTSQEIQNQVVSTGNIQKIIEATEQRTSNVKDTANIVLQTVQAGVILSNEVSEHSAKVDENTNRMSETIHTLTEKVSDVSSIAETILSISQQTNLLALNASIEAARAGDAGKGFAVVAEEIRLLSEDTRVSTGKIADIIKELNEATNNTMEILHESVESIKEEGIKVTEVNKSFLDTGEAIKHLSGLLDEIRSDVKTLFSSNHSIVEGISQLSGTTQEVTAVSQEGMNISDTIIEKMVSFNELITEINELVKSLEKIVCTTMDNESNI